MLSITINRDVEQYQEAVVAGLNGKQTVTSIIMIVAYVSVFMFCYFVLKLPMLVCIYAALPICIPIVMTGFGTKNGMSFWERRKRSRKRKKPLTYISHENKFSYSELMKKATKIEDNNKNNDFANEVRKLKKIGIIGAILTVLLLIGVILLKTLYFN